MTLGERIEGRLRDLNMSQSELARRAQLPQTTINSLIRGTRRSSPHVVRLARELRTTPAYLMGDTDDYSAPDVAAPDLSADQRELLDLFNAMDEASQRSLMHIARSMGTPPPPKPTIHSPKLAYAGPPPRK